MNIRDLEKLAARVRITTLKMLTRAGSGHATSCMSIIEILVLLYFASINSDPVMRVDPNKSQWEDRDFFVLGKIQAAPSLYSVLAERGFFPSDYLLTYGELDSPLQACPTIKLPGVDAPCSSSSHGLSYAAGLAQSLKIDRKKNRVYSVVNDASLQEGQFWEAAMSAAHNNLDNLFLFVDRSRYQADGSIAQIMEVDPVYEKFEAFGWRAIRVVDGHDFDTLLNHLARAWSVNRKPTVLICRTVKGKGIPFAENKTYYHGVPLSEQEVREVLPYLERIANHN